MQAPFDPIEILRVLIEHEVDVIVVGGVAGTLAGSPVSTRDLDLVYDSSAKNLDRLVAALEHLKARYKDPAGRRIMPDAAKLAAIKVNLLITDRGDLDLLRSVGEDLDYASLVTRTVEYSLEGFRIRAIDLDTLIEAKTYADRPKDHYALPFLRELLRLSKGRSDDSK